MGDGLPPLSPDGTSYGDRLDMATMRSCLLLLLRSRLCLALQVEKAETDLQRKRREKAEGLDPFRFLQDLQNILRRQLAGGDDEDLVRLIQELKEQLVIELRKNHALSRSLAKLDTRIALMIKNRGNLQQLTSKVRRPDERPSKKRELREIKLNTKSIENYQDLFYLLQTEPQYLARVVFLVKADQMDYFLETTILTLFGDAFSPREEYLVLKLFQHAIQHEINVIQHASDFLQAESVLPKMIVTYNRRKQGISYIQKVLGPVMKSILEEDRNIELNPMTVYFKMINEHEIRTGEKSKLPRDITPEKALNNPTVSKIVDESLEELSDICKLFVNAILQSVNELPYGLRWICKQISSICLESLQDSNTAENRKLIGYFVYYRFLNVAIVTPDSQQLQLVKKELSPLSRKSCVVISKVLQTLFNLRTFSEDHKSETFSFMRLNPFIEEYLPKVEAFFDMLVKVEDPEDHLQVDKYMELTQKTKPVIHISFHEIFETHLMISKHLEKIAPDVDDPLRIIMKDLTYSPEFSDIAEEEDREIQLTLTNRFKVEVEEESEVEKCYAETTELVIPVLRQVPMKAGIRRLYLQEVLSTGLEYAKQTDNKELTSQIDRIYANLKVLEKEGVVKKQDHYESFLQDVAQSVVNRDAIRGKQKREVTRLKSTLSSLRLHQSFLQDQITEYNGYLDDLLKSLFEKPKKKQAKKYRAGGKIGPYKYSYTELTKKGVVIDSVLDSVASKTTTFYITSEEPGIFEIAAKVAKLEVEKIELRIDDLLVKHYNNDAHLELDQVTLDVNMTIHLLNNILAKSK